MANSNHIEDTPRMDTSLDKKDKPSLTDQSFEVVRIVRLDHGVNESIDNILGESPNHSPISKP
jgi:hypothetical protein